jgi:hypothetical protein
MRAGFEVFRAFDQDVQDNRDGLKRNGKLAIPVLAVFGSISTTGPRAEEMMREVADNVTGLCVANAAHWIAEENPEALTTGLLRFLTSAETNESSCSHTSYLPAQCSAHLALMRFWPDREGACRSKC